MLKPFLFASVLLQVALLQPLSAEIRGLPNRTDSLKFAVIGDSGMGKPTQYEVGARMAAMRLAFPFDMVIMLGDNMYGRQQPADFLPKFERPYAPLLKAGVRFYATLGNHDLQSNRFYAPFNMDGRRYYTYVRDNVRFFVLDSNRLDPEQLAWFEEVLKTANETWKISYFHHPLYSNGRRHGPHVNLRAQLEPLIVAHGVNVVFSGHDHVYERLLPQNGIHYFVSGSAGQVRQGGLRQSAMTAAGFDRDESFMLVEIAGSDLFFVAISRAGQTVDSGVITRKAKS